MATDTLDSKQNKKCIGCFFLTIIEKLNTLLIEKKIKDPELCKL